MSLVLADLFDGLRHPDNPFHTGHRYVGEAGHHTEPLLQDRGQDLFVHHAVDPDRRVAQAFVQPRVDERFLVCELGETGA